MWNGLTKELQTTLEQILPILTSKLAEAISKIERLLAPKKSQIPVSKSQPPQQHGVQRIKYALSKESLDNAMQDVAKSQEAFDATWHLIIFMTSNPRIDAELSNYNGGSDSGPLGSTQSLRRALQDIADTTEYTKNLKKEELPRNTIKDIPFSLAKFAQHKGRLYVLDPAPCIVQGNVDQLSLDVRNLARKFLHSDPLQFGLLKGDGFIKGRDPDNPANVMFTFVFNAIPGNSEPRSLRDLMMSGAADHSLSDRLEIANDLAKAVSFVHTFGFVHKNICPENILLSTGNASSLGHSYLVGFGAFRNAEGHSWRQGDDAWERNLYRHPHRQGLIPDQHYIMQHDIYSLGVCLLEVGLWESFVHYSSPRLCGPSPAFSATLAASGAASNKDCFVLVTQTVLPRRMGTKYSKIVETCLTCLDTGNTDFGDESEFRDADGVLVAVRYIEKVSIFVRLPHTSGFTYIHRCSLSCPRLLFSLDLEDCEHTDCSTTADHGRTKNTWNSLNTCR